MASYRIDPQLLHTLQRYRLLRYLRYLKTPKLRFDANMFWFEKKSTGKLQTLLDNKKKPLLLLIHFRLQERTEKKLANQIKTCQEARIVLANKLFSGAASGNLAGVAILCQNHVKCTYPLLRWFHAWADMLGIIGYFIMYPLKLIVVIVLR